MVSLCSVHSKCSWFVTCAQVACVQHVDGTLAFVAVPEFRVIDTIATSDYGEKPLLGCCPVLR
jgi:hypothetical protein